MEVKCVRCGYKWYKRSEGRPLTCPGCRSRRWDKEYIVAPDPLRFDVLLGELWRYECNGNIARFARLIDVSYISAHNYVHGVSRAGHEIQARMEEIIAQRDKPPEKEKDISFF